MIQYFVGVTLLSDTKNPCSYWGVLIKTNSQQLPDAGNSQHAEGKSP